MSVLTPERSRSRLLVTFIGTGLAFMLIPGTFLGVWNLVQISGRESVSLVSPAWLQAHGHAQIFGWIGSFILGIGFYSLPASRQQAASGLRQAWMAWLVWTAGVLMRWATNVYGGPWQILLPASAVLELTAFALLFSKVARHRPDGALGLQPAVRIVISATIGLGLTLLFNLGACLYVARLGQTPALPHGLDQRYLTLATWGFLAPFIWGFSAKWLPVMLGLRTTRVRPLLTGVLVNAVAVVLALAGWIAASAALVPIGAALVIAGLRLFERSESAAKTRGVSVGFPLFVRLAYLWLLVSSLLTLSAAIWDVSGGIWGAARHAFTVGFVSTMVFSIGQRVLPAFAGARVLWSPRLMSASVICLNVGCLLRVASEIPAYQHGAAWAWSVLPISAMTEMTAVTFFAVNLLVTLLGERGMSAAPAVAAAAR
ncbi:MAG TPA: NnrS family protein [Vicinamibacterales bacterium]|nr:NnrS family protein [Vicinamibacterales bacterium]